MNNSFGSNSFSHNHTKSKDIFSEIKQEVTQIKESNELIEIKNSVINSKISNTLKKLTDIVDNKMLIHKLFGLNTIKLYNKISIFDIARTDLVISKIKYNLYSLMNIYRQYKQKKRLQKFLKWKTTVKQLEILNQLKSKIQQEIKIKLEKEKTEQLLKIKEKDKELNELKINLSKLINSENEQKKKMKGLDDKEQKYLQIINKLEVIYI